MTRASRLLALLAGWLACVTAGAAGCSRPARLAYEAELAETPSGLHHAVHTERLAEVMRGLDRLTHARLPQEVDLEAASDPLLAELVEVARGIAASAEAIPEAAFGSGTLTGRERVEFHRRAGLLRERALALARDAPAMTPEERSRATLDLRAVCDGCHADFRATPPSDGLLRPVGPGRAAGS